MDAPATPQQRGVDWATVLPDVLTAVLLSLSPRDCLAVRGVCTQWRAVAKNFPFHAPIRLMLRRPAPEGHTAVFGFFSIGRNQVVDFGISDAALGCRLRCCGQYDGWLALVSDEGYKMLLLNPVTDARVRLPPCSEVRSHCSPGPDFASPLLVHVKKVVLSASPSAKECIVAAVGTSSYVALCRPEHGEKWITLDAGRGAAIEDVMFAREGKLFVLATDGSLRICDLRSYPRAAAVSVVRPGAHLAVPDNIVVRRYLVESSGEVIVVSRHYKGYRRRAAPFHVFKLLCGPSASWIPVTDLGDRSLLVSTSSSESITVADSKDTSLRKNSIYFTRQVNSIRASGDVEVFSMKSMSSTCFNYVFGKHLQDHEAVWVRPSL